MNQLVIEISGPEVAEAVGRFMPDLAKAMTAERERAEAHWAKTGGFGWAANATAAGAADGVTEAGDIVEVKTVPAEPAPAPVEKKPRAKKAVEPEPAKQEAEETCLDVKPSAEAQQELPLEGEKVEPAPAPTIDDLRRHLRTYGQANGAEALSALYAEYGAKQLSDLPAEKYAEIIAKVSA